MKLIVSTLLASAFVAIACSPQSGSTKSTKMETDDKKPEQPEKKVTKSDAEWRKQLTPEQYAIARQAATERSHGAVYEQFAKQGAGTYYCVGCDAELFHSKTKFDSRCGWPAFYDASKHKNIKTKADHSGGWTRVEVLCAKCDAHLGHVFEGETFQGKDGKAFKTPTDKRYCINGTILKFVPDKAVKEQTKSENKEPKKEEAKKDEP